MGGGLESRCVGRVYGAYGAVLSFCIPISMSTISGLLISTGLSIMRELPQYKLMLADTFTEFGLHLQ